MMTAAQTPRRRGAPPAGQRLTRAAVLSAAEGLLVEDGLDDFSMRRLASSLGVRPNALYNHVEDRENLLALVADRFLAGFLLPEGDGPWPSWLSDVARALRARFRGSPALARVALARAGTTAAGPERLVAFHRRLEGAGLDPALAHAAWHAVLTLVVGVVQQEQVLDRDETAMFEAVLDLTVRAVESAAEGPVPTSARNLLAAHPHGADPGPTYQLY